jgi:hypothetical protein
MSDFETTTEAHDCRVWAWALLDLESDEVLHGIDIRSFFITVQTLKNPLIYFHNLRFDGEFLLHWLLSEGFKWVKTKQETADRTFTSLISDKGTFYSIEVVFKRSDKHSKRVTFYDSLKLLPFSVAEIARGFKLPIQKGSIDYAAPRPIGYDPTPEEWSYIDTDVRIVASALKVLLAEGMTKMTIGSNALTAYKTQLGEKRFGIYFPTPHYDADIRQSYRGGFTYLNPAYAGKVVHDGLVFDVNSLYPSVMRFCAMPFGEPLWYAGAYEEDPIYPLYIQMLTANFKLKPGHIPTIQLKNNLAFIPTEYITDSGVEDVTLCLTSVDLALFMDHYDVTNIVYHSGWKFRAAPGMFDDYIDGWSARKIQAKREGNHAIYILAKLMLNNLYGKFALNPLTASKIPVLQDGVVKYLPSDPELRLPVYLPVGTFITAYARNVTIRAAQRVYPRFIYADTDSLHLEGLDLPDLDMDDTRLGAWKWEGKFRKAKFLRAKTYLEEIADPRSETYELKITCAGMPQSCYGSVNFETFEPGASYGGKLVPKHVPGGLILQSIDFTIASKSDNIKDEGTVLTDRPSVRGST